MLARLQSEVVEAGDRSERAAAALDSADELAPLRREFDIPKQKVFEDGGILLRSEYIYLAASSLGLQPRRVRKREKSLWDRFDDVPPERAGLAGELALSGELCGRCCRALGALLGAEAEAVRLLPGPRPVPTLCLLAEGLTRPGAAVLAADCLEGCPAGLERAPLLGLAGRLRAAPAGGAAGGGVGAVLAPLFDMASGTAVNLEDLVEAARQVGCLVGVDASDAAGAVGPLRLAERGVDFAVLSTERYLGGGPDGLTAVFLGSRAGPASGQPGLHFIGGEGPSPAPVGRLAALSEALDVLAARPAEELAGKQAALAAYAAFLLQPPAADGQPAGRESGGVSVRMEPGGHFLSLRAPGLSRATLAERRVVVDERGGSLVVSPSALYTSFLDVYRFAQHVREALGGAAPPGEDECTGQAQSCAALVPADLRDRVAWQRAVCGHCM